MYHILMTIASIVIIIIGKDLGEHNGPAVVWTALMVFGGAMLGHVITDALDRDQ